MKKIKSLLSLMLVMVFMLSLAGPMAFADSPDGTEANPYPATLRCNIHFNTGKGAYEVLGWHVYDGNGSSLDSELPSDLKIALDASGSIVKATPSHTVFKATNAGYYYQITNIEGDTFTKPVLTITADAMAYDAAEKKFVGDHAVVTGLVDGDNITSITYNTVDQGNTVSVVPATVTVKNADAVVTNKYVQNFVGADLSKPTVTLKVANPEYNAEAGKFVISGLDVGNTDALKLSTGTSDKAVANFNMTDVVFTDADNTVTASLDKSKVYLSIGSADVSAAYLVTISDGTYTKPTIHVYPDAPVNGTTQHYAYSVTNDDGTPFTAYDVEATAYMDNGVAKIDSTNVKVMRSGYDYAKAFNIVLHTTSTDGAGDTGNNGGNGGNTTGGNNGGNGGNTTTTPTTSLVVYTGSKSWVYDGTVHSYTSSDSISYTGLPTNWKVSASYKDGAKITTVGTVVNEAEITVYNEHGEKVDPSDYKVVYGTLTVTKRPVTIQATSAGKVPNGYTFSEKDAKGVKFADNTSLVTGDKLADGGLKVQYKLGTTVYTDYKNVTKAGTYIKELLMNDNVAVIVDAAGNDKTDNYQITLVDGTLTINSGWVSPDTGDHSNMVLWIVLLAASAVAAAAIVFVVLKKSKKA